MLFVRSNGAIGSARRSMRIEPRARDQYESAGSRVARPLWNREALALACGAFVINDDGSLRMDVGLIPSHTVRLASAAVRCYLPRDLFSVVNGVASPDRIFGGCRRASGVRHEIIQWKNQRT